MNKSRFAQVLLSTLALSFSTSIFAANQCNDIKMQTLGAGGPEINDGLASSSFLVWVQGKARIMIDAGGGSEFNFEKSGASFNDLQAILFTHLHVDHSAALPAYIKAGFFTDRDKQLDIYGPNAGGSFPSTTTFVSALFSNKQKSAYPYLADNLHPQSSSDFLIKPHNIDPKNKIWQKKLANNISISAINVTHGPIPALAWRVDYGKCSVTFSGDMNGSSGNLPKLAKNTNLLVANNAIPEDAGRIAKRLHMTPSKIGQIAEKANVKKLALAHFMLRSVNKTDETKTIIQKYYHHDAMLLKELKRLSIAP
ncbi:MAG: MBL fold metallo-hydrolase [Parashewanella sp.]